MKKNNTVKKVLVSALVVGAVLGTGKTSEASTWRANSIASIQQALGQDKAKYGENVYDIRWGDYLYGISQATGVNIDTLASINKIANKNLIYTGNKLYYGADTLVTKDNNGNITAYRQGENGSVQAVNPNQLTNREQRDIAKNHPSLQGQSGIKNLTDANKGLIAENNQKLKELEGKVAEYKKQKEATQKTGEGLKESLQKYRNDLDKIKDPVKRAEIENKIKELEALINAETQKGTDLDKKVEDQNKEIEKLRKENEQLRKEIKENKEKDEGKTNNNTTSLIFDNSYWYEHGTGGSSSVTKEDSLDKLKEKAIKDLAKAGITDKAIVDKINAAKTVDELKKVITDVVNEHDAKLLKEKELNEAKSKAIEELKLAGIESEQNFDKIINAKTKEDVENLKNEILKTYEQSVNPQERALRAAKAKALMELENAGIKSKFLLDRIRNAKTPEGVESLKNELLKAHEASKSEEEKKLDAAKAQAIKDLAEAGIKTDEAKKKVTDAKTVEEVEAAKKVLLESKEKAENAKDLEKEAEGKAKESEKIKLEVKELENKTAENEKKIKELEENGKAKEEKLQTLEDNQAKAKESIDKLTEDIDKKSKELANVEEQLKTLDGKTKTEIELLQAQKAELDNKVKSLEKAKTQAEAKTKELQEEIETNKKAAAEAKQALDVEINKLKEENAKNEEEKNKANKKITSLEEEIKNINEITTKLRREIENGIDVKDKFIDNNLGIKLIYDGDNTFSATVNGFYDKDAGKYYSGDISINIDANKTELSESEKENYLNIGTLNSENPFDNTITYTYDFYSDYRSKNHIKAKLPKGYVFKEGMKVYLVQNNGSDRYTVFTTVRPSKKAEAVENSSTEDKGEEKVDAPAPVEKNERRTPSKEVTPEEKNENKKEESTAPAEGKTESPEKEQSENKGEKKVDSPAPAETEQK